MKIIYIIGSILDFAITCWILKLGGSEVNPLASYYLETYGLIGLGLYKFFLVSIIIGLLYKINKPSLDRFAVGSVMLVVVYSFCLLAWR